ncbi:MAG: hypothetical protein MUF87_05895, partial [Anaerolineae bacterium]|nr:hypothetical protein [Anaerolineae bacterium]
LATIRHDGGRFRPLNRVNNTQNYIRTDGNMDWAYSSGVITPLPTPTPTRTLTHTPTPTRMPSETPLPPLVISFSVENVSPNVVGGTATVQAYPLDTTPIPYADKIKITVRIDNNTTQPLRNWELQLFGVISAGQASYTNTEHLGFVERVNGLHNGSRIRWTGVEIGAGQAITVSDYVEARHSGPILGNYTFTYTDGNGIQQNIPNTLVTIFGADLDRIDFNGPDQGIKAAMFWAIFNETSEGRTLDYRPAGVGCQSRGWTIPSTNIDIFRVVHGDDANTLGCNSSLVMDVQTMINGVLNVERLQETYDTNKLHTYFTTNYKGSLGNQPRPPQKYEGELINGISYPDEVNSNWLWMIPICWPPESNGTPLTYREALLTQDDAKILSWLEHYANCNASMWSSDIDNLYSQSRLDFYNRVYADPDSIINTVIDQYEQNCLASYALASYTLCDPSEGSFQRKVANRLSGTDAEEISIVISNCTGDTPLTALLNSQVNAKFYEFMWVIGSPHYTPTSTPSPREIYYPVFDSILQPVIFFDRQRDAQYRVQSCRWISNVYQRVDNPYFYQR